MDVLICVLTIQISLIFIKQWYSERTRESKNYVSLSYGLYYFFILLGFLTYSFRRYEFVNTFLWELFLIESTFSYFLYFLSIFIMGIGSLIFSFTLEYNYRQYLKTHYGFSLSLIFMMFMILILRETPFFFPILNTFAAVSALFPFVFLYYLIKNSLGKIRNKLILGLFSLSISISGIIGLSDQVIKILRNLDPNYQGYLLLFKILAIIGLILMIFSFFGFSLLLEAHWKGNIISLFIIDKQHGKRVYTKNFIELDESNLEKREVLAGGIKGIIDIMNELSKSDEKLRIIDKENLKFILDHGEKIISCLYVKRNLINIHYFLNIITRQFENTFSDVYEQGIENNEFFKPIDGIIKKLFPNI